MEQKFHKKICSQLDEDKKKKTFSKIPDDDHHFSFCAVCLVASFVNCNWLSDFVVAEIWGNKKLITI